jgi:hypothetical protein
VSKAFETDIRRRTNNRVRRISKIKNEERSNKMTNLMTFMRVGRKIFQNAKNPVLWISLFVIVLFAWLSVTRAQTGTNADVVTTISNLENDAVKADLAGDTAFYQKILAEDWTRGDSDGTFYTKADVLKLMADTKSFKTNSEKLSELKVRVYGNTAVATYKDTYDILIKGEHRAHHHRHGYFRKDGRRMEAGRESRVRGEVAAYSDARTRPIGGSIRHFQTREPIA